MSELFPWFPAMKDMPRECFCCNASTCGAHSTWRNLTKGVYEYRMGSMDDTSRAQVIALCDAVITHDHNHNDNMDDLSAIHRAYAIEWSIRINENRPLWPVTD